jgi:predicted TIM-barrel fold metal-dependent hydrolase
MDLDFAAVDLDHHYYEAVDAFTRHLDPEYAQRGVQVVTAGNRTRLLAGGRLLNFIPNPTFDPIIVAGCIELLFRGEIPEGVDPRSLMQVEPLRAEYQDRYARLARIAEQHLGAVVMLPTLGCGVEEALKDDVDATMASLSAFNQWIEDDWGWSYADTIYSTAMLSLADPEAALGELERLITRGVRIVHIRPAPVPGPYGTSRSLGHPSHDPVWARLQEANIPVAFHLADSGYNAFASMWGGDERFEGYAKNPSILGKVIVADRAIHDTIASLVVDGVFWRFPDLRVISIENGSDFVALLAKRLKKQANQTPWAFEEDGLETIRRNVWVTPYYEEDLVALAELIGVDRIVFGSDFPHGEGLYEPTDFAKELTSFSTNEVEQIMRTNGLEVLGQPVA